MDFKDLYTTTTGRISRKTWWLGSIGLVIIVIIISFVLGAVFGVTGLANSAFGNGLLSLAMLAIMFIPYRALTLKRLHDRNRPENLFWIFLAPSIASAVLMMLGLSGSMQTISMFGQEASGFQPNMLGNLVNLASLGVGIWALVELGFLKGDDGQNAHGPDPLGGSAASTA